jgi:CheY-like chemotaxis protein
MAVHRVLVVDDHVDCAETLGLILNFVGYEARCANSGEEALVIARTWQPWAACVDIAMPHMNGYDLARELQRECQPAPILFAITGLQGTDIVKRCHEAGYVRHFLKPCDPRRVVSELDRMRASPERLTA